MPERLFPGKTTTFYVVRVPGVAMADNRLFLGRIVEGAATVRPKLVAWNGNLEQNSVSPSIYFGDRNTSE